MVWYYRIQYATWHRTNINFNCHKHSILEFTLKSMKLAITLKKMKIIKFQTDIKVQISQNECDVA